MASYEFPNRHWREILKQMFVCQSIDRNGKGAEIGKGRSSPGKLKERLIHFGREPNGYSALAILRYVYPIHSRLHSFFRFDDDAKLKKRDSGDVSYSKKSVSYLETALNQINTEGGGESRIGSFPSPFSLSLSLSELLPYLLFFGDSLIFRGRHAIVGSEATVESGARIEARLVFHLIDV